MANSPPVVDFATWVGDFLAQAVGDGTWADVVVTPKVDDVAADASDQSTNAAQLWANAQDDMFGQTWARLFADRKVWRATSLLELQSRGLSVQVQEGDLGHIPAPSGDAGLYECTDVDPFGGSTWAPVAGGGGTPQDLATTLQNGFLTGNRPIVHETGSTHEWRGQEFVPGIYIPIAKTSAIVDGGSTFGGGSWSPVATLVAAAPIIPPLSATAGIVTIEGAIHYFVPTPPPGFNAVTAVRFSESWEYTNFGIPSWTLRSSTTTGDTAQVRVEVNASNRLELQRLDPPAVGGLGIGWQVSGYVRITEHASGISAP